MSVKQEGQGPKLRARDERRKRSVAVGAVLGPLVAPALARQGAALAQIVPHWGAICPLLAAYSAPESLRGDVLSVAVASDGVKQELHYITPQIIESVNALLGYAAVAKVRAVTRHEVALQAAPRVVPRKAAAPGKAHDKAEAVCQSVRDEGLREALVRLGAHMKNKGD